MEQEEVLKIYVATSWKNATYSIVVRAIRESGHEVLDWSATDVALPDFRQLDERFGAASSTGSWEPQLAQEMLKRAEVVAAYSRDIQMLEECDALVLLTPCGRNAHFEAGYAQGNGKACALFLAPGVEPELMTAGMHAVSDVESLIRWIESASTAPAA